MASVEQVFVLFPTWNGRDEKGGLSGPSRAVVLVGEHGFVQSKVLPLVFFPPRWCLLTKRRAE